MRYRYAVRLHVVDQTPSSNVWWTCPWRDDEDGHRVTGFGDHMGSAALFDRPEDAVAAAATASPRFSAEVVRVRVDSDGRVHHPRLRRNQP